ncbi:DUF4190 domain-containing protein [Streptomyces sp. NPDC003042]
MSNPAPPQPPNGPGHYWPPPSPPPVWGPPAHQHPPALNGFALASLLVGLLCFPPLGIVFGGVAMVQIARKRERGRALAIVGVSVSMVMTVALVFGIERYAEPFFDRLGSDQAFEETEGQLADIEELREGDCFNVPGGDLLADDPFVYRIGCARTHDAEVTSSNQLDLPGFPGMPKLKETATDLCWKAQDAYAMDTWALPSYAEMFYFAPTRESWREGDRRLVCVIGTAEEDHEGSLRKDAAMLTPDQVALLRVLNEADHVLGGGPDAEVEEALADYRTWAREVDAALAAEARLLQGVAARPEVGAAARAQLREVEAARKEWQRASRATKPADFEQAWDRALAAINLDTEKALRGAYGLATEVPQWLEEYPGPSGGGAGGGPSSESA